MTLFVNGLNFGCIYTQADALKAAYDAGHQIGSHTWGHPDLALLNASQVAEQIGRLNTAFHKILGAVPTYLRPPYGSYNQQTLDALTASGSGISTVALWDVDSDDGLGVNISGSMARYEAASLADAHNILHHETHQTTALELVPMMIAWAQNRSLRMVTVAECLGDAHPPYADFITPEKRNPSWVC